MPKSCTAPVHRSHSDRTGTAAEPVAPTALESAGAPQTSGAPQPETETGGPDGPEPTRYGDWERKGRCIDF